jgi:hypothetical protein
VETSAPTIVGVQWEVTGPADQTNPSCEAVRRPYPTSFGTARQAPLPGQNRQESLSSPRNGHFWKRPSHGELPSVASDGRMLGASRPLAREWSNSALRISHRRARRRTQDPRANRALSEASLSAPRDQVDGLGPKPLGLEFDQLWPGIRLVSGPRGDLPVRDGLGAKVDDGTAMVDPWSLARQS